MFWYEKSSDKLLYSNFANKAFDLNVYTVTNDHLETEK